MVTLLHHNHARARGDTDVALPADAGAADLTEEIIRGQHNGPGDHTHQGALVIKHGCGHHHHRQVTQIRCKRLGDLWRQLAHRLAEIGARRKVGAHQAGGFRIDLQHRSVLVHQEEVFEQVGQRALALHDQAGKLAKRRGVHLHGLGGLRQHAKALNQLSVQLVGHHFRDRGHLATGLALQFLAADGHIDQADDDHRQHDRPGEQDHAPVRQPVKPCPHQPRAPSVMGCSETIINNNLPRWTRLSGRCQSEGLEPLLQ